MSLNISHTGLLSTIWARARDILSQIMSAWGLLVACRRIATLTSQWNDKTCHLGKVWRRRSLHLSNGQHPFDDLSIVSHRHDPQITAKESKKAHQILINTQTTFNQKPNKDATTFIDLCWTPDKISSSFLPLKGACRSMKQFRCTCTNFSIFSKSPDSSRPPGTSSGSTSRKAVPGQDNMKSGF